MDIRSVLPAVHQLLDPVLVSSSSFDKQLGLPAGSIAAAATSTVTVLTLALCSGLCFGNRRKAAKAERKRKRTVLLAGPVNSGKTAMLHKLMFNKDVETVMSMQPNAIHARLAGCSPEDPTVNVVDFPGAGQLREALMRAAPDAGALVVVVDAGGDAAHLASAAGLLYDMMTSRTLVDGSASAGAGAGGPPPVMIVAHKADKAGARNVDALRKELEADLERLKVSRAAVVTHGTDTDGSGEEERLLLGRPKVPFTFAADAPMNITWAAASSKAGQLDKVRSFILENVA